VDINGILGAVKNSLQAGQVSFCVTYAFGWSAFLFRIRFCDTSSYLSKYHHHYQVNLASEFGEAGQVLGGNVMRATDVTGQITEDIIAKSGSLAVDASEGLREILGGLTAAPNRVKSIAASTPSALQDLATATWGSTNHITGKLAILSLWGEDICVRTYINMKYCYALRCMYNIYMDVCIQIYINIRIFEKFLILFLILRSLRCCPYKQCGIILSNYSELESFFG
jgi:hypothetical protein